MKNGLTWSQRRINKKFDKNYAKAENRIIRKEIENLVEKQNTIKENIITKSKDYPAEGKLFTLSEQADYYESVIDFTKDVLKDAPKELEEIETNGSINIDSYNEEENVVKPNESVKEFCKQYNGLKRQLRIVNNGLKGEQDTYKALKMLDYKIDILQNICLPLGDETVEHDIIVVCENGIFTIEVKYVSKSDAEITAQGLLNNKNVVEQSRKHVHSLKRIFADTKFADVPVYPLIVFSNDRCDVYSDNDNIKVCYRNDIESIIFDDDDYKNCLTKAQIKEISGIITDISNGIEIPRFAIEFDETNYFELLAEAASQILIINEKKELEEKLKKNKDFLEDNNIGLKIIKGIGVVAIGTLYLLYGNDD